MVASRSDCVDEQQAEREEGCRADEAGVVHARGGLDHGLAEGRNKPGQPAGMW
jgi:hypothetical protein